MIQMTIIEKLDNPKHLSKWRYNIQLQIKAASKERMFTPWDQGKDHMARHQISQHGAAES